MLYREETECRVCGGPLWPVIQLGNQALPDFDRTAPEWRRAPLDLVVCGECHLHQLRHTVDRKELFTRYWYRSSTSETMREALADVADYAKSLVTLEPNRAVLDIGSNDGTLLSHFAEQVTLGFEPAIIENPVFTPTYRYGFFNLDDYRVPIREFAKIVFSIAMFYSVEDPVRFIRDVKSILAPDGIWVLQMNDFQGLLDGAYDIIGHEHVCIWSPGVLQEILSNHGLTMVRHQRIPLNGGTARIVIQHQGGPLKRDAETEDVLLEELNFAYEPRVQRWTARTALSIAKLNDLVRQLTKDGAKIHLKGASTRGSTIVQAAMLDKPLIEAASDRDPNKWGYLFPGTDIPIVSEEQSRALKPDYYLMLIYSYQKQVFEREHEFIARGGKFIIPVPEPEILELVATS